MTIYCSIQVGHWLPTATAKPIILMTANMMEHRVRTTGANS
ncbi:MAG: hypothetical protein QNJ70_17115 [Xenococcaceae cyanobacterium MO_207.B15]|nr:hypothetical protein [Xenococcaceae cyanobacterium MO_207.B15]